MIDLTPFLVGALPIIGLGIGFVMGQRAAEHAHGLPPAAPDAVITAEALSALHLKTSTDRVNFDSQLRVLNGQLRAVIKEVGGIRSQLGRPQARTGEPAGD